MLLLGLVRVHKSSYSLAPLKYLQGFFTNIDGLVAFVGTWFFSRTWAFLGQMLLWLGHGLCWDIWHSCSLGDKAFVAADGTPSSQRACIRDTRILVQHQLACDGHIMSSYARPMQTCTITIMLAFVVVCTW